MPPGHPTPREPSAPHLEAVVGFELGHVYACGLTCSLTVDRAFQIDIVPEVPPCLHLRTAGLLMGTVTQNVEPFCCTMVAVHEELSVAHVVAILNHRIGSLPGVALWTYANSREPRVLPSITKTSILY